MRKIAVVLSLVAVLLAAAFFAGPTLFPEFYYRGPGTYTARCPITVTQGGKPVELKDAYPDWVISISDSHKTAPQLQVSRSSTVPPGSAASRSCELEITKVPGKPLEGTDWRIGYTLTAVDPATLRGRKAQVSLTLKGHPPIEFGAASVYVYDGVGVKAAAGIKSVGENWQIYKLDVPIDPKATTFEFWLRLGIHSTISTTGSVYMADPRIDLP